MRSLTHSISQKKYNQPMGELNPLSLFRNGEQGVWYDPSDIKLGWRRNLLMNSNTPSWMTFNGTITVTNNYANAPDGTFTAQRIQFPLSTSANQAGLSYSVNNGTYTSSVWMRVASGTAQIKFGFYDGNVKNNFVTLTTTWQRFSSTQSLVPYGARVCWIFPEGDSNAQDIQVWGAQLETGALSSYQPITDGIQDYYTYHPLPTLYQDSAGTTPVTAVEQPVGLMLDKSKGGIGLEQITDGTFTLSTGWTLGSGFSIAGGVLVSSLSSSKTASYDASNIIAGKWYQASWEQVAPGANSTRINIVSPADNIIGNYINGNGKKSTIFYATVSGKFGLFNYDSGCSYDNVSVREVPGNHASQSTSASRPTLSARVNLLTKTELFNDAVWTKIGATTAPSANTINLPNTLEAIYQTYSISPTVGTKFTGSVTLSGSGTILIFVARITGVGYEETTSTITLTSTPTRYSVTHTVVNAGQTSFAIGISRGGSGTATTVTATGAQLEVAAIATTYQKVVTATDYNTVGFPLYLKCDGVDDGMATNSIDFSGTNKMTVSTGIRKNSDASGAIFFELSSNPSANNGTFYIYPGNYTNANGAYYTSHSRGTASETATQCVQASPFTSPISNVLSSTHDIGASITTMRVNGAAFPDATGTKGTGNFGNYPLYLFRRAGSSLPFNGQMYGLIIRGAVTPTATIQKIEKYMNKKVGKIY